MGAPAAPGFAIKAFAPRADNPRVFRNALGPDRLELELPPMNATARADREAPPEPRSPEQEATLKAASAWLQQLARTLKTCRLYDASNPTVVRFRTELGVALRKVLDEHGPLRYRFTSDDVFFDEASIYPARSRDDNLALAFYRDGVRGITFLPGIEPREIDVLIEAVLLVSGQNFGEDDLITLLWEAQLPHLEVDYVPAEGEVGGASAPDDGTPLMPWPTAAVEETAADETHSAATAAESPHAGAESRSDDWNAGDLTVEIEAGFEELESLSTSEVARFRDEFRAEHEVPTVTATIAVAYAYNAAGAGPDDRAELARFAPRLLRQAVTHGSWLEAREALLLLRQCGTGEWSMETFAQELLQPISISSAVEKLDQQEGPAVLEFITFARELGDPSVDWLNLVLAESQSRRNRKLLAEAIAELCRSNPERLAPWISDPRWFVVRNIVHILGWIGGSGTIGMLQSAIRHPDIRVRQEVISALGQVEPRLARPLLVRMLDGADPRMFCGVLHQLATERDAGTARLMLNYLQDPNFETRSPEERHAIYATLSATGGDESIPDLEAELHKGNWFAHNQEIHRASVARILARIATPLARMVLERGAQSKRAPIRKACEEALMGFPT